MTDAVARLSAALADRYRIERELGQGGMATVYLAEDLKHDRKVALKVLRPELAAVIGAERFLAEIKTTANLQHPHILALFDSGKVDGTVFYVMPYVEGESLRDRLTREKQLPIGDAVRIATEVADALQYAHGHGVIHRDIKPENILLHGGHALVADFGIALAAATTGGARMTETGMSLGTPHYMSPEQAMGERTLDARTDIYALGCVLYEMLIGEPPFRGPTAQAIVAKVMTDEPRPPSQLRRSVPEAVEEAVLTALEKLPADRFESAKEFAEALGGKAVGRLGGRAAGRAGSTGSHSRQQLVPALSVALVALGALAAWGWLRPREVVMAPASRLTLATPTEEQLPSPISPCLALSPDGEWLVYPVGRSGTDYDLWLRRLDRLSGSPIPDSHLAASPAFSPDGRSLVFQAGKSTGELRVVPIGGGVPTSLGSSPVETGTAWGDDGFIYYAGGHDIRRVPASGGAAASVTPDDSATRGEEFARPVILPGARWLLYVMGTGPQSAIHVLRLGTRETRRLGPGIMASYLGRGYLAMVQRDGTVDVAPFDPERAELRGPVKPFLQGVEILPFQNGAAFATSPAGTLIYSEFQIPQGTPVWVERTGQVQAIEAGWHDGYDNPALSPDGSSIAVSLTSRAGRDIWIKRVGGALSRLTLDGSGNVRPSWSPDGRSILYTTGRGGLRSQLADGSGPVTPVPTSGRGFEGVWSADGQWLVYRVGGGGSGDSRDIWARGMGRDTTQLPLLTSPADEYSPALSPDGRWLAYVSDESGKLEVYLRPFPEVTRGKWQVSTAGGSEPMWAHSGRELFFRSADRRMVAAPLVLGDQAAVGPQRVLFDAQPFAEEGIHADYAVSPDDRRFLMIRLDPRPAGRHVVLTNFFTDIRATVGAP